MRLQTMSMLGVHHNAELSVLQLCFQQPPTAAADDDDFLDFFSHDDIFFHRQFRSLIYNDYDRALHDLSADSTMTSLLLCDKPTYLLAD